MIPSIFRKSIHAFSVPHLVYLVLSPKLEQIVEIYGAYSPMHWFTSIILWSTCILITSTVLMTDAVYFEED